MSGDQKRCSFCGDTSRVVMSGKYGDLLCHIHYMQFYHTGKLKPRKRTEENEIIFHNDFAEIVLTDKDCAECGRAIIDIQDVERVRSYKWCLRSNGYVATKILGNTVLLHRLLLEPDRDHVVDHINHDTLDNRRSNLRLATFSQNNMNSRIPANNSSGAKGVSWSDRDKRFEAYITTDGVRKRLGNFTNLENAKEARRNAEEHEFGEFMYRGDMN